jgi:TRAP-type C4-dicarboxylate transport system substrate-binding protein
MKTFKTGFAVFVILLGGSTVALAATQIKIATLAPQNSQWATDFTAGAAEIKEKTEGRVILKFYWGGHKVRRLKCCRR